MIKLRQIGLLLIGLSFLTQIFASEAKTSYGIETVESIQGTGLIRLNGTSIVTELQVTGSLITKDASIGTLNILGEANLTDTLVKGKGTIVGSLQAIRTTFEHSITIVGQRALFTASKLEGITMQQDSGFKGKQVIELKQGTIVNGPIHFESGKGEVVISPGCKITGQITGGKLVKKA